MTHSDYRFEVAGRSDIGCRRTVNEDSFIIREDMALWAVADGVGGLNAGDIASQMVVSALGKVVGEPSARTTLEATKNAIINVNRDMLALGHANPELSSMGSTIACMLVHSGYAAILWAGDSRVYRWREGELTRVTKDHSLVQSMVDAGEVGEAEAENHPQSNVITSAVGLSETFQLDTVTEAIAPSDVYIICSDGLTSVISDGELCKLIAGAENIDDFADELIAHSIDRLVRDNVTLIALRVHQH
ncbi:MAG: protein phosphatase 2C domain-containing protein [Pseudomonadota bacterium]